MIASAPAPLATPRLGLIFDEIDADYRRSGALGSTEIRAYLQNQDGYRLRYVDRHPQAQFHGSDSTELGTMVHLLLQGEDHYRARCVIAPPECFTASGERSRSQEARTIFDRFALIGRIAMSPDEDAKVRFLVERIRSNPVALRLMTGGKPEVTGRLRDPHTGLLVQARFDVLHDEWLADFKTTSQPIRQFKWQVRDYALHVQAALYQMVRVGCRGGAPVPFHWVVQSTVWPFECRVFECSEALMDAGMMAVDSALSGIAAKDWGTPQSEPEIMEGVA
jgi:hypothetical protein